jgi:hypothetical protein
MFGGLSYVINELKDFIHPALQKQKTVVVWYVFQLAASPSLVDRVMRSEWNYRNEPILNIFERLIEFHANKVPNSAAREEQKRRYLAYEGSCYGIFLRWTCLG